METSNRWGKTKMSKKNLKQIFRENGYAVNTDIQKGIGNLCVENVLKCVKKWLAGKLVAGSEKATPSNDVILKLLHELDYQQEKEKQK